MPPSTAAKDWDEVRTGFASSIMVDTPLASLAQNLDGLEWPFIGSDEKPSTYLDFTYAELQAEFEGRGQPGAAELLVQILRETLSFDQPFGEMVKQTEAFSERDNPMLRTLSRLQVPENFPITLTTLDESTRELCRLENVSTIGAFALFAQNVSQNVIVGGTFRELLNALAQVDEKTLATFLPLRPGTPGLHFLESLVQATRAPNPSAHVTAAISWFADEAGEWRQSAANDANAVRSRLAVLHDPAIEERIAQLLASHFPTQAAPRKSAWSSLVRWIKG
jgi:hypothetical protein